MFFIAYFILSIACAIVTIKTLVGYSDMKMRKKIVISSIIFLGWMAPLIIYFMHDQVGVNNSIFNLISFIGYNFWGFLFILFCLFLIRDVVWYLVYGALRLININDWSINPKNISVLGKANFIIVVLSFFIGCYALYEGNKIPDINYLNISHKNVQHNLRIVQLSDMHINRSTSVKRIQKIVDKVNALYPDIIVMTGNIFSDDIIFLTEHLLVLEKLKANNGIYAALGNHEQYNGLNPWIYQYNKSGFKVLFNQGELLGQDIFLAGIPDPYTATLHESLNINLPQALKGSTTKQYKILLSNSPLLINSITPYNFQLMLSGNTLGGQIFPLHFLIKRANQYLSGKYRINGIDLYVSNGVGTIGPTMRLLAPSEITVIDLQKK